MKTKKATYNFQMAKWIPLYFENVILNFKYI